MEYFLERIAKSIYSEFGDQLNSHCLVFPGRRAGLFFMKHLAAEISKPVWTPKILTINELFQSLSDMKVAENEILLPELFKVYRNIAGIQESFDDFYFWGEMILNDFDDVDKYLVDSSKLFQNVHDIRKIDQQFGDLSPEQIDIVRQFWVNFNPGMSTNEKTKFISIWSILNDLYAGFRENLRQKNLGYEGMIFRDVIENQRWKEKNIRWKTLHFIGFNALNECEKELMSAFKASGKSRFYWDYDNSYIAANNQNTAGFFLKENIRIFGNDMPADWSYDTLLSLPSDSVRRQIIDTSSDVAQVKLIPELIRGLPGITEENAHQTAIILADENLLLPVLTSLPADIPDVNITMGYPLRQTAVYSLVRSILEMQQNCRESGETTWFYHRDVIRILKNSLISGLINESGSDFIKEITGENIIWIPQNRFAHAEFLSGIFKRPATPALISEHLKSVLLLIASLKTDAENNYFNEIFPDKIRNEFIYRIILSINRLETVTGNSELNISVRAWIRLLDRILKAQTIPFSGEPLSGIQIMGILETRTLDFKNLIILSVNEGILPSVTASSSFIPFSLREAFGLPSVNHQESIFAYHFYRLLHKAENVTFLFNSNPDGLRSGEMSRFLQQMKYEPSGNPEFLTLGFEIKNHASVSTIIERTEEHNSRLIDRFSPGTRILSPMAINIWLNCRMKFYYRYVNDLKEPEGISEEIDPAMLGILLHRIMKKLYENFIGKIVDPEIARSILRNKTQITDMVTDAIRENFGRQDDVLVAANEQIVRNVLMVFISRILEMDMQIGPFTVMSVERPVSFPLHFQKSGSLIEINLGGTIDRVDIKDGKTRIVDYKTGTVADNISSTDDLFIDDRNKDKDGWLQTLLYCEGYLISESGAKVKPSIYKIKKKPIDQPDDSLLIKTSARDSDPLEDYETIRKEFMQGLKETVETIFDPEEPFVMTTDTWNKCPVCPYRTLCMR